MRISARGPRRNIRAAKCEVVEACAGAGRRRAVGVARKSARNRGMLQPPVLGGAGAKMRAWLADLQCHRRYSNSRRHNLARPYNSLYMIGNKRPYVLAVCWYFEMSADVVRRHPRQHARQASISAPARVARRTCFAAADGAAMAKFAPENIMPSYRRHRIARHFYRQSVVIFLSSYAVKRQRNASKKRERASTGVMCIENGGRRQSSSMWRRSSWPSPGGWRQ